MARFRDIGVVWKEPNPDPMVRTGYYVEYTSVSTGSSMTKPCPNYDQALSYARYLSKNGGIGGVSDGVPLRKRGLPNEDRRYDPDELLAHLCSCGEWVVHRPQFALDMYRTGKVEPKMPMAQAVAYLERLIEIFVPISEEEFHEFVRDYLKFDGDKPFGKDFFMSDMIKGIRDTGFLDQGLIATKDDKNAFLYIRLNYVHHDLYELPYMAAMRFDAMKAEYTRTLTV